MGVLYLTQVLKLEINFKEIAHTGRSVKNFMWDSEIMEIVTYKGENIWGSYEKMAIMDLDMTV